MMLNKTLTKFKEDAMKSDSYWVEKAKLDFSLTLDSQREHADISYAEIARRINSSPAYISKVFRGDSNLTIESMVKLARSVGGQLDIRIVDSSSTSKWQLTSLKKLNLNQSLTSNYAVTRYISEAANHSSFDKEVAYA